MATWSGQPAVKGRSETVRMILLSFVTIGLTFTWGVEMTYITPYLLNLGLTKSNTSLVWIAGPLSGLIVQPLVGAIADRSTSRWGRRRPLMVVGSLIVSTCLIVLGFTRNVVGILISDDETAKRPTIVLAVLTIYVVDFALNAVMSCSKSLLVDSLPVEKQQIGAAWASRMSSIGHLLGYAAGAVDMVQLFGTTLGDTQFKQLTVVASIFILISTTVTCWAVTERVLVSPPPAKHQGRFGVVRHIFSTLFNLPPRIQAICWAQFWAWIGWFPFSFYSTTWVGETYFRYDAPDAKKPDDMLGAIGRIGSTSFVIYSTINFLGAWILPLFVRSPEDQPFTHRPPHAIQGLLARFSQIKKPDLLTTWILGHLMFAGAMSLAPLATSFRFATLLVCLCGIPSAIASWAPSALLGMEVNKLGSTPHRQSSGVEVELSGLDASHGLLEDEHESDSEYLEISSSTSELSGIYFGILNIYITLPQFVGTFISTIVFAILEPGRSPELSDDPKHKWDPKRPNAIAVCLFIGAMGTFVAAYVTRKLQRM